jgi:hypothetical protein
MMDGLRDENVGVDVLVEFNFMEVGRVKRSCSVNLTGDKSCCG